MSGRDSENARLRATVGESFNIFQATIAIAAIFMGFVFAALLQLLAVEGELIGPQRLAAGALTFAMVLLMGAVVCFHYTANQVVQYWGIFFPHSKSRSAGALMFTAGILLMLISAGWLVYVKDMFLETGVIAVALLLLTVYIVVNFRRLHHNAPYKIDVTKPSWRYSREPSSPREAPSIADTPSEERVALHAMGRAEPAPRSLGLTIVFLGAIAGVVGASLTRGNRESRTQRSETED